MTYCFLNFVSAISDLALMLFHSTPLLALAFRLRLLDIAQADQHLLNLLMQPGQYIHAHGHVLFNLH